MNQSTPTDARVNVYRNPHVEKLETLSHKIHLLIGRIEHDPGLPLLRHRNPSIAGVLERASRRLEGAELRTVRAVQEAVTGCEGALRELERVRAILEELQKTRKPEGA